MIDKIVHSSEPVLLVGGAAYPADGLRALTQAAPRAVAADGGAAHLLDAGIIPDAVIGDLDSLGADLAERIGRERIHRIEEQDSTDFEKCLMRITAPVIIGAGFLGGGLGHHLAALSGLLRFCDQPCILLGGGEAVFLCPPKLLLDLPLGTPISLFPLAPVRADGSGLQWSFEGLEMAPGQRIGTSNRVTGPASLTMSAPAVLCIVPDSALGALITQLAAQHGSWPARA